MPPSTLLVVLSLLAAVAAATATSYCSSGSIDIISGNTVVYRQIALQTAVTDIHFTNYCSTPMQGLFVVACSYYSPPPTVIVQNMNVAKVLTNSPQSTFVQGYAFCSGGAAAAHSENDILPLIGGASPIGGLMRPNGMLPLSVGRPGAEAVPVREVEPTDRYYQLPWNRS